MDLDVEPPSHEQTPRSDDASADALQPALLLGNAAKPRPEPPPIRLVHRTGPTTAAHPASSPEAAAPAGRRSTRSTPRILPPAMLESLLFLAIAVLIVMPVVAIFLLGLQRVSGSEWPPRYLALVTLAITVVLVLAYLVFT